MRSPRYRFGDYELHPHSRELRRDGAPVSLPLKSFDCLVYLIQRNHRAVGRDELISAVWGRTDVSDALLGQTLARARRAVGDSGEAQSVIRTVSGFGYQWVAPVSTEDILAPESEAPALTEPPSTLDPAESPAVRASPRSTRIAFVAALVLVAAIAAFVLVRRETGAEPEAPAAADTYLVLPVAVAEDEPDTRWIRLGAMDFIASRLRERAGLPVLPADQTIAYIGGRRDADLSDRAERWRLAQAASATHVLTASARRTENGWSFELDAQDAEQTKRYAATAATPLEAADLAIGELLAASGMRASVTEPQFPTLVELRQRIDAAFLEGDLRHASELIEAAPLEAQQDPGIAVRAAEVDERSGRMELAEREFARLAEGGAATAVHGRALYGLCAIAYRRNDLEGAERRCRDALAALADQREPMLLGRIYMLRAVIDDDLGRIDEAMKGFGLARLEWRRAGNLPGEASVDVNEGLADTRNGRLNDAVAAFDRATAVFARFGVQDHLASARAAKSDAQRMLLDHEGALASSAEAWQLAAHMSDIRAVRAIGYSRALALVSTGRFDEAERLLERFDAAAPESPPEFAVLHLEILAERGHASEAADRADAMLDRVRHPPDPSSDARLSYAALVLVEAALRANRPAVAERVVERVRDAGADPQDPRRPYALDLASAEVAAAKREDAAADRQYASALDRAVRANRPDDTVRAASGYLGFLLDRGRVDEAKQIAGRLVVHADRDFRAAQAMARFYAALGDTQSAEEARRRTVALAGQRTP
ncbi:winged helix-turn-helix domain-containing protein [Dokdonella sp.]|uniref:winged helix-turn-helix domain-containing protein n=1 Tax=Dokdonella sp. TaxID=2291710 RepID=UPI001B0EE29D|nr:winged helix-turn-helix domain-containing protein [Dokdonella sp.]MBO9662770.1 winged helix-turn-helix domain-containing protein [Dokdonella sp.]